MRRFFAVARRRGASAPGAAIVYRPRAEMPAREEVERAEQEAVRFRYLASPTRHIGDEQHWVRQMQRVRLKMGEPGPHAHATPFTKMVPSREQRLLATRVNGAFTGHLR